MSLVMTKTMNSAAARLTDVQLARLDAYISLRALEIATLGVDTRTLMNLLAAIRPAWGDDATAHEIAAEHWARVSSHPQGRAALETALTDLAAERAA